MNVHRREEVVSYTVIPVAGFTTRLGRVSFQKANGDVLLSNVDLD
jgi:hypothetical protein